MVDWAVTIRATIVKTYGIHAITEDEAIEKAYEIFSAKHDDVPETHNEDVIKVQEVEHVD